MTTIEDDYTEGDRWDWDRSDDSQYCKHGTFIGSWWGPDLLCGFCEDGISDREFAEWQLRQRLRKIDDAYTAYVALREYIEANRQGLFSTTFAWLIADAVLQFESQENMDLWLRINKGRRWVMDPA